MTPVSLTFITLLTITYNGEVKAITMPSQNVCEEARCEILYGMSCKDKHDMDTAPRTTGCAPNKICVDTTVGYVYAVSSQTVRHAMCIVDTSLFTEPSK